MTFKLFDGYPELVERKRIRQIHRKSTFHGDESEHLSTSSYRPGRYLVQQQEPVNQALGRCRQLDYVSFMRVLRFEQPSLSAIYPSQSNPYDMSSTTTLSVARQAQGSTQTEQEPRKLGTCIPRKAKLEGGARGQSAGWADFPGTIPAGGTALVAGREPVELWIPRLRTS